MITTREDGERVVVRLQAAAGYDFVKVYDNFTAEAFEGVVSAAKELLPGIVDDRSWTPHRDLGGRSWAHEWRNPIMERQRRRKPPAGGLATKLDSSEV